MKNVADVVKQGATVKVKVLSVDVAQRRLALTMKGMGGAGGRRGAAGGPAMSSFETGEGAGPCGGMRGRGMPPLLSYAAVPCGAADPCYRHLPAEAPARAAARLPPLRVPPHPRTRTPAPPSTAPPPPDEAEEEGEEVAMEAGDVTYDGVVFRVEDATIDAEGYDEADEFEAEADADLAVIAALENSIVQVGGAGGGEGGEAAHVAGRTARGRASTVRPLGGLGRGLGATAALAKQRRRGPPPSGVMSGRLSAA